jgi:hypothetical protein
VYGDAATAAASGFVGSKPVGAGGYPGAIGMPGAGGMGVGIRTAVG